MIKNIIFDFGDVFINLDKEATLRELLKREVIVTPDMFEIAKKYEVGAMSSEEFLNAFHNRFPHVSKQEFKDIWNAILLDFPVHRYKFIQELALSKQYRLFLLSNTNEMHISWIQNHWGMKLYTNFKSCFEVFYLSHEMGYRKPNADIYEFVLEKNALQATETLFIDDTQENTDAAKRLGIHVWNINPEKEDVSTLLTRKEFVL